MKIIKIPRNLHNVLQNLLDSKTNPKTPGDVIHTFGISYGDIEIDIKITKSNSGPYIDTILFENGEEIATLEPRYKLLGHYLFKKGYGVKLKLTPL